MATELAIDGANYSGAAEGVLLPASLPTPIGLWYLGGTAAKSIRNLATRDALGGAPVGPITYNSNYCRLTGGSAYFDTLLRGTTQALTLFVVARAVSSNITAVADKPVFLGNRGFDPLVNGGVSFSPGVSLTTNGIPAGPGAPQANNVAQTMWNTGTVGSPIYSSSINATVVATDITAWRMTAVVRNPGVAFTVHDRTAGLSGTQSLVNRIIVLNSEKTFAIGHDWQFNGSGALSKGQCDVAVAGIFSAALTDPQLATLTTFIRAAMAKRGLTGF